MDASRAHRPVRLLLMGLLLLGLVGAAQVGGKLAPPAERMTGAARKFLDSLNEDQRKVAQFPFDAEERSKWNFVPLQDRNKQPTRKGLRLELMNDIQKQAALELLQCGLSPSGYQRATTIMSLESVLAEQEKGRGPVRHPGWYFVTIFGEPGLTNPWGWRIDGHHLSLNFTLAGGKVTGVTPAFLGANPGEVKAGERQGTRPLAGALDHAVALMKLLSDDQKGKCLVKPFGEVQGQTVAAKVGGPVGLNYGELTTEQQAQLRKLVDDYVENFAIDLSAAERARVASAGWDKLSFAFSGGLTANDAVTYRVQGPNLLVEFLNVQNDGAGNKNNHYHTSWRTLPADFGTGR
jgi:hypothetical protein